MNNAGRSRKKLDWVIIFVYMSLVGIGWLNIYSASLDNATSNFFDFNQIYFKQLIWIAFSLVIIIFILAVDAKLYERFSSIIYLISLVSLAGLFVFGKEINGATSWYAVGGSTIQPGEFAKAATALALGKYISDIQVNIRNLRQQLWSFVIIMLPMILILPQPDPGSALVFAAFIFPLYREGLPNIYLLLGFFLAALFVATLAFGVYWISGFIVMVIAILYFRAKRKRKRPGAVKYLIATLFFVGFVFSVNYIFNNVFEQRHRDRFNIVLGKETDTQGIGYNTTQSEIAIGSGGWTGKGWTQGTQTKGNFVPEQQTDYIFSTVGEEWGFIGSMIVIILFTTLLIRVLIVAERQKNQFSRVYCYGVASVLFIHFFVNVGMVIGILPTIGIPLPFFSYGGSGLWGFTILLFILVRLDAANYLHA